MNTRISILSALVVGIAFGALAGCQTYDFEPVEPLAISQKSTTVLGAGLRAKPNLMMLVDKSGSMNDPITPSLPACQVGGSPCGNGTCPSNCPTRWSELKNAMDSFLKTYGTVGRMGVVFFPKDTVCTAPSLTDVAVQIPDSDDDATLQAAANAINIAIKGVTVVGGTPTGNSLQMLSGYQPLLTNSDKRGQFILLLTDGLPNCNDKNPASYSTNPTACQCTLASNGCSQQQFDRQGCLDKDNTIVQIQSLQSRGIKTIVIGFGAELQTGTAPETLNAMAAAGGFPRSCPNETDEECGGAAGACDVASHTCQQKFYQASNGDDLAKALTEIQRRLGVDPCIYDLGATPSEPSLLTVIVDGQTTTSGPDTWAYDTSEGEPKVKFQGDLCTRLTNATEDKPIHVEFRVVEGL